MKTGYRKQMRRDASHAGDFWYVWIGHGYFRPVKTFNEIRQNTADLHDLADEPISCHPRSRRSDGNLDAWRDVRRGREYGRSWKDFTRHAKQWMVGLDPVAIGR